ncbi:MAG: cell division protein FtsA, partial [Ignavibacteriales bacterium]|nr:cell division protein FtsA [Ignavibacteriales bacterium]
MAKKEQIQPPLFVGLDIGTTKICVIIISPNANGELNVLGIGQVNSDGVAKGEIKNLEKVSASVQNAITQAEERAGVKISSVVTGIAGDHVQSFQSRGVIAINNPEQEIKRNDVLRLLNDTRRVALPPDRKILHVFPQEFIIDGQDGIHDPVGMNGIRLEATVHVVTSAIGAIKNIEKCVQRSGIKVHDVVLQQLASSYATLVDEEKELGVALVDIGGGTTDVAVFEDGVLRHTASIPYAGNHVTQDLRKGLGLLQEQAEKVKCEHGNAFSKNIIEDEPIVLPGIAGRSPVEISKETICRIIQPRMEEIFELVADELKRSGFAKQLAAGIVLTGGGAMIKGTSDLAQTMFSMPVKLGMPFGFSGGLVKEIEHPTYATAAGL